MERVCHPKSHLYNNVQNPPQSFVDFVTFEDGIHIAIHNKTLWITTLKKKVHRKQSSLRKPDRNCRLLLNLLKLCKSRRKRWTNLLYLFNGPLDKGGGVGLHVITHTIHFQHDIFWNEFWIENSVKVKVKDCETNASAYNEQITQTPSTIRYACVAWNGCYALDSPVTKNKNKKK